MRWYLLAAGSQAGLQRTSQPSTGDGTQEAKPQVSPAVPKLSAVQDTELKKQTTKYAQGEREKWTQIRIYFCSEVLLSELERGAGGEAALTCFAEEHKALPFALAWCHVPVYQLVLAVIIHGGTSGSCSLQEGRCQRGPAPLMQAEQVPAWSRAPGRDANSGGDIAPK